MKRFMVAASILACFLSGNATAEPGVDPIEYGEQLLVQFAVSDLDRSIEFYRDTLGLEFEDRNDGIKWAKFVLPNGTRLGIGEAEQVDGSGTTSLNLAVKDIDAARDELERRGVEFSGPTIDIPGVVRLADLQDPDGNKIRLAGAPQKKADGEAGGS